LKYKSVLEEFAKQDLKETSFYYDSVQVGLGKLFLAAIKKSIKLLEIYPVISQIRYFEVHTFVVDTFPYLIHYYIDESSKNIVIIGILHTSRNPVIWKERF
jgi:ParE toxin of type II toxin-antitoxin system, parDE